MLYFAPWKVGLVSAVLLIGALFAMPNVTPGGVPAPLSALLPSKTINLGLDLQGGSHLLYEVDTDGVRADRLQQARVEARRILRQAGIPEDAPVGIDPETETVVVRVAAGTDRDQALTQLSDVLAQPIAQDEAGRQFTVREDETGAIRIGVTPDYVQYIERRTVQEAQEVIRRRIDSVGVTEPSIQRQGANRVLVQAPGVDDPDLLKARIGATGQMTFQLVAKQYGPDEAYDFAESAMENGAGDIAAAMAPGVRALHPGVLVGSSITADISAVLAAGIENGAAELNAVLFTAGAGGFDDQSAITNIEAALGATFAELLPRHAPAELASVAAALASTSGDPAPSRLIGEAFRDHLNVAAQFAPTTTALIANELLATDIPREPFIIVSRTVELDGERLRNAALGYSDPDRPNRPTVDFQFDTQGARIFCNLTRENAPVGNDFTRFATILDDVVITAPQINGAICQGSGYITGSFTDDEARNLSALLNAGSLPAELTIVEERTVGAELGRDSVRAGTIALAIGFAAVIVFMGIAYRLFGIFANMALLANVVLIAGALSALQATLTLPGIAGIILTIGMAVDANVLIFERIREEMRAGRTPANAIEAGYRRAQSTILDANITTLIAAVLLYIFGSGPVKGFAVTLAIGIFTSVFTAFVVSRALIAAWFRQARPKALPV